MATNEFILRHTFNITKPGNYKMTEYIDDSGKVLMSLNDNKDEIIKISSLPKDEQEEILYLANLDFDINWAGL